MILTIAISPSLFENSFTQQISLHQQWKKFADVDMLTCKSGYLLIQKSIDSPACVVPSTYLKLVDRGYGFHNQSIMNKNPEMMNNFLNGMVSN